MIYGIVTGSGFPGCTIPSLGRILLDPAEWFKAATAVKATHLETEIGKNCLVIRIISNHHDVHEFDEERVHVIGTDTLIDMETPEEAALSSGRRPIHSAFES